ncbi:MAG: OB-fold nucleic acid binding domain-containing protein, partial [Pseudomonadota bacterium]
MERVEEKLFVESIREGRQVDAVFLIDDLRLGTTKNGKPYAGFKLKDRTGSLEARVWDGAESFCQTFKNGEPVRISGLAESFQGQIQVKVTGARNVPADAIDPAWLVPSSPFNIDDMFAELQGLVAGLSDRHLRELLEGFLTDSEFAASFKRAPAAKNFHHAYAGGLLEHTLSVARAADAAARLYPFLRRDLLLAG